MFSWKFNHFSWHQKQQIFLCINGWEINSCFNITIYYVTQWEFSIFVQKEYALYNHWHKRYWIFDFIVFVSDGKSIVLNKNNEIRGKWLCHFFSNLPGFSMDSLLTHHIAHLPSICCGEYLHPPKNYYSHFLKSFRQSYAPLNLNL